MPDGTPRKTLYELLPAIYREQDAERGERACSERPNGGKRDRHDRSRSRPFSQQPSPRPTSHR